MIPRWKRPSAWSTCSCARTARRLPPSPMRRARPWRMRNWPPTPRSSPPMSRSARPSPKRLTARMVLTAPTVPISRSVLTVNPMVTTTTTPPAPRSTRRVRPLAHRLRPPSRGRALLPTPRLLRDLLRLPLPSPALDRDLRRPTLRRRHTLSRHALRPRTTRPRQRRRVPRPVQHRPPRPAPCRAPTPARRRPLAPPPHLAPRLVLPLASRLARRPTMLRALRTLRVRTSRRLLARVAPNRR